MIFINNKYDYFIFTTKSSVNNVHSPHSVKNDNYELDLQCCSAKQKIPK